MENINRVLHIVRCLEQGGIQNFLMNVYRNINRDKIQFDFLVSADGVFEEEIKELGGKYYHIPYITEIGRKKYQKELKKFLIEHEEYKIIHCHLNQISGVVLEVAKELNIPVRIAHAHTMKNTNSLPIKIYKAYLQRKINKSATHFFACSKEAAEWMFKRKSSKANIIYNGIQIEKFFFSVEKRKSIREENKIEDKAMVLGHVGRFSKVKNQSFLLDIFYEYYKRNQDTELLLIGEGETKEEIIAKAHEMGIENKVKFLGNRKDVENYYSAFDCFLFPSLFEGLGIVLIEAQVNGLNCIISDTVPKEVDLDGKVKFMSLNQKASEWAKQIEKSDRREEISKEILQKYDIKQIAKKIEEFYIDSIISFSENQVLYPNDTYKDI